MQKIKTVFMGTAEFAVPILKKLINSERFEVVCIVTQPDRPAGRDQLLKFSDVKKYLVDNDLDIKILQPDKLKNISEELLNMYKPELVIVASYGQIIPPNILNYPKFKCLNFHGSILPALRGAVPVQMAILQGFEETGVTLQLMSEGLDEGDIIGVRKLKLLGDETTETLMKDLAWIASEMIDYKLIDWIDSKIEPVAQKNEEATYCQKSDISKEKAEILFDTDILVAERMVRAFYPWPVAWIKRPQDQKILKISSARISDQNSFADKLEIFIKDKKLFLNLKNGTLELLEVQLEGKKRDSAINYLYLGG